SVSCSDGLVIRREDCSEQPTTSTPASDGGRSAARAECVAGGLDSRCTMPLTWCDPGAATTCDAPPRCGPIVTGSWSATSAPSATGGTIVDGVDALTALNI